MDYETVQALGNLFNKLNKINDKLDDINNRLDDQEHNISDLHDEIIAYKESEKIWWYFYRIEPDKKD